MLAVGPAMRLEHLLDEINWVHVLNALNWGVQIPLLTLIVVVMRRRQVCRRFPWFFRYLVWVLGSNLALAPLYWRASEPRVYWWLFRLSWLQYAVTVGLGFLVIYEVFCRLFEAYKGFQRWGPQAFRLAAAGLLLAAAILAYLGPGTETLHLTAALLNASRTLRFVQAGLLLAVLFCVAWLRLPWRQPAIGIALGFGIYAAFNFVRMTVRLYTGWWGDLLNQMLDPTSYTCTTIIWAAYMLRKPAEVPSGGLPQTDVTQWNQVLSELLGR